MTNLNHMLDDDGLDAIAARLLAHRDAQAATIAVPTESDDVFGDVGPEEVSPQARADAERYEIAAREVGDMLHLIGGFRLMHAVVDRAEDVGGVTLAAWISHCWTGIGEILP